MHENSESLVYNISKESIIAQIEQRQSLESKANTLIAFSGGLFALLMGGINSILSLPVFNQVLILISISLFIISVIFSTLVSWVRRYYVFPNLNVLTSKYLQVPEDKTKLQLISNMKQDWNENLKKLETVALHLRIAFLSQIIGFIILGSSLFIAIV